MRCVTVDNCSCNSFVLNITDEANAATMFIKLLLKEKYFKLHFNNKHIINVYNGNDSIMHRFFGNKQ